MATMIIMPGIIFVISLIIFTGIHKIEEGFVGVYYKFGVLHKEISEPVQTDQVTDIPCGTSGGVLIYFEKIEVVNRLKKQFVFETIKNYTSDYDRIWIYDKIHHEINQFCSQHTLQEVFIDMFETLDESLMMALQQSLKIWAPGVEILSIRVTKPKIPSSVKSLFEEMENERTKLLIMTEKQKVQIQEAQTKKKQNIIKGITFCRLIAKSELEVTTINVNKTIREKESELNLLKIENQIYLEKDSDYNKSLSSLKINQEKLTKEYIHYASTEALMSNLKLVLGESIPNVNTSIPFTTKKIN